MPVLSTRRMISGALLAVLVSGCGGSEDGAAENGARIIRSGEQGEWRAGQAWRLVEEVRIGAADGEGPEVFGNVVDVALDEMGRVWVADGQQNQIRVFDARGNHVRSVGKKGGGPGEFAGIDGMEWAPDWRLWVLDAGNSRFAVYDSSGTLVGTQRRNSILSSTPWPGRFDDQGRLYDVNGQVGSDGSIETTIVRSAQDGQGADTFRVPRFEPALFRLARGNATNRVITEVNVPFTGSQVWAVDPQGYVWVANTARYRIERHAFSGGIDRIVERTHTPVPVSREERTRMLERYRGFIQKGGKVDLARIPDTHPALNGFLFDDTGHLWVSATTDARKGRVLDVFEPAGTYLGRVAFPSPAVGSVRTIRGGRLVVVARDSLDVPTIILMRIEKPGR